MIEITNDKSRRLVIAHMGGMLTVGEVDAFSIRYQSTVREMGLQSGEFDLLVITKGNLVQTQEVMNVFSKLIMNSPIKSRKIATVRDGVLTRMQVRRLSKMRSNAEVFDNLPDAEAWLTEP